MKDVPFIQIDFNNEPVIFTNPIKVITTDNIHEVVQCLNEIEQAQKDGYYAAGFISYEANEAFHDRQLTTKRPNHFPLLWFGIFKQQTSFTKHDMQPYQCSNWSLAITKKQFNDVFHHIQQEITNKSLSQINYTTTYETTFSGDSYSYYKRLKAAQQADYCAYINTGDYHIISVSPELFFEQTGNIIKTKPMKGTIERGLSFEDDVNKRNWLKQSAKNKYENDLTTQLMYEEIEQIAEKDTVHVIDQHHVEQYPTVFQMTSTIKATLKKDIGFTNILQTIFPCASITGTPKSDAIKLIHELETSPRHVYCGTIGYLSPNDKAIFNVPIRTVIIDQANNIATYGVGGAITKNSTADEEFAEIKAKAKVLQTKRPTFQLLETFGLIDGNFIVFNNHLNRLKQSAQYFNFEIELADIKQQLLEQKKRYKDGKWRLRLLVNNDGSFTIDVQELDIVNDLKVVLAEKPIDKNNPFLYHKTTYRSIYEQHIVKRNNIFDTLLWNDQKQITEFTIGNIVIEIDGKLYTPPVESGLLPGTYREKLLQRGKIEERTIYIEDLKRSTNIWLINSVRKWVKVKLES